MSLLVNFRILTTITSFFVWICKMTFLLFCLTGSFVIPPIVFSSEISVVSIILGGNPAYEYKLSAPTYKLAFQAAQSAFANLTFREINFVKRGISKTCDDEEHLAFDSTTQIYEILSRLSGPAVIQTPGCTDVALLLGDFARELSLPILLRQYSVKAEDLPSYIFKHAAKVAFDIPKTDLTFRFDSTAGDPAFLNKQRYPTALNFGPADHGSLADGARQFLQLYNWSTITILCGTKYASVKPFETSTCDNIYQTLTSKHSPGQFDVYRTYFNPEIPSEYRFHLYQSKLRSRIIVLCLDAPFLRSTMAEAVDLSMTDGDYVFLSVQSNVFKNQLDRIWNKKDSNNTRMIQAFTTLIIYANKGPNWDAISELVGGINTNINLDGNGTVRRSGSPSIPVNSLNIAAYEAFMVMASVLQENSAATKQYLGKKQASSELTSNFVKQFRNRHFYLRSGVINLNIYGYRRTDTIFLRFSSDSLRFEEGWFYNISANVLVSVSNVSGIWPNRSGPPPDRPKCGYADDGCYDESGKRILLIGCLTAVLGIMLMVLALV